MKNQILSLSILVFGGLFISESVFGHAYLRLPVPRTNNDGIKTGPCGGIARTATPTVFTPGQVITVQWSESIQHRGFYLFSFSPANDANFNQYALKAVFDDQDNNVADRANPATHHQYTTQVTLPNMECENCTFQMIQVMCDNPNIAIDPNNLIDLANPVTPAGCTNYYSCADIRLAGNAPPPPPPPGGGNGSQDLGSTIPKGGKAGFGGGGCGVVKSENNSSAWSIILFLIPLISVHFVLRRSMPKTS